MSQGALPFPSLIRLLVNDLGTLFFSPLSLAHLLLISLLVKTWSEVRKEQKEENAIVFVTFLLIVFEKAFGGREDWRWNEIVTKFTDNAIDFNYVKVWVAEIIETEFVLQVLI